MAPRTDDELFEDFRTRGDTAALAALFDRTAKELLRVAVHLTGDLGDAEDLVQETYLAALRGARRYRPEGRLRAWLVGILQNHARRLRRRRWQTGASLDAELPDRHAADGLASATAAERRAIARDVLERVPEPYRTVLGLRYAHGFSVQEIAATLDRPVNTVQSQLQRGTERLRRMLPDETGIAALAAVSTDGLVTVRAQVLAAAASTVAAGAGTAATIQIALAIAALVAVVVGMPWALAELGAAPAVPTALATSGIVTVAAPAPGDDPIDRTPIELGSPPPSVPTLPWGSELVEVRVVDAATGKPVPGARVTAFDHRTQTRIDALAPEAWHESWRQFVDDLEAYQLRFGVEHVADTRGVVRLPLIQTAGPMTARSDRRYGERWDWGADRIVIAPDRQLRVRVADHSGRPVPGVRVHLGWDPTTPCSRDPRDGYRNAHTDDAGIAVLRHVQVCADALREHLGRNALFIVPYVLGGAAEPIHRIQLDDGPLPDTLDVRLPPAGTAAVRVVDVRGARVGRNERWHLSVDARLVDGDGRWAGEIGADGVARFAFLPIGRALRFTASLANYETPPIEHPGLRRDGEHLAIEIPFGPQATTVFGRAVDAGGEPLGRIALIACLPGEWWPSTQRLDTGEDGTFRLVVPDLMPGADVVLHRIEVRRRGPIELDERLLGATATLRGIPSAPGAVHDVGDVVLAEPTPLGTGTWRVEPPSLADEVRWLEPKVERRSSLVGDWAALPGAFVVWHDDGTFAVHGDRVAGAVRLGGPSIFSGFCDSLALAPLEFAPGARDLHVDLVAGSQLALDFVGPPDALRFDLVPDPGVWPAHDERQLIDRRADTRLVVMTGERGRSAPVVGPLWPGRYRVTVRLAGVDEPVLVLDELDVPPGMRIRPLFERPLDVTDRFDVVDVTLVDDEGDRADRGTVWLRELATGRVHELPFEGGRLARGIRRGGFEAVATAPGRGSVVFDDRNDGTVSLPARRRVQVLLRDRAPAGVAFRIELEPAADHPLRRFADVPGIAKRLAPRQPHAESQIVICAPGRYTARVIAQRNGAAVVAHQALVEIDAATTAVELPVPQNVWR